MTRFRAAQVRAPAASPSENIKQQERDYDHRNSKRPAIKRTTRYAIHRHAEMHREQTCEHEHVAKHPVHLIGPDGSLLSLGIKHHIRNLTKDGLNDHENAKACTKRTMIAVEAQLLRTTSRCVDDDHDEASDTKEHSTDLNDDMDPARDAKDQ